MCLDLWKKVKWDFIAVHEVRVYSNCFQKSTEQMFILVCTFFYLYVRIFLLIIGKVICNMIE